MSTLYLDCFSGIAGDMFLGALLDLAAQMNASDQVNEHQLQRALSSLKLPPWSISTKASSKQGIKGLQVSVHTPWGEEVVEDTHPSDRHKHEHEDAHEHTHEHAHEHGLSLLKIIHMIEHSALSPNVKERAIKVFEQLGAAESKSHGIPPEEVHFHEVGMIDSIVDIVGCAWCLDQLKVIELISAPPPINRGWVKCAHGLMPLPAPATAHLLQGIDTRPDEEQFELVTPTGAAMIKTWVSNVTDLLPPHPIKAIGLGAGKRDLNSRPNLFRVFLYDTLAPSHDRELASPHASPSNECWRLESNLDDMTPEHLSFVTKQLFEAGALDVWSSPIVMKKGRSAITLSALCSLQCRESLERIFFEQSSSIGLRVERISRIVLPRRFLRVNTPWGEIDVKVSRLDRQGENTLWKCKPEYDQLETLCEAHQLSISTAYVKVLALAQSLIDREGETLWTSMLPEGERSI